MQHHIVQYLQTQFQPDSIILHGSRARGKERPHSDWDFILLYIQPTAVKSGRLLLDNQNIEYSVATLPIDDIFGTFDTKLNKAKVVFDTNDTGANLVAKAALYYDAGVHWNTEKHDSHRLWLRGRVAGMHDSLDNPLLFQKYFSDFYGRVFNYWYWLIAHRHSEPIYVAVDEIKQTDPAYFILLNALADTSTSPLVKKQLAEDICNYLGM